MADRYRIEIQSGFDPILLAAVVKALESFQMILDWEKVKVFVKPGPTDMRKQINGLSIIVSENLEMNPFEGNLFLCLQQTQADSENHLLGP